MPKEKKVAFSTYKEGGRLQLAYGDRLIQADIWRLVSVKLIYGDWVPSRSPVEMEALFNVTYGLRLFLSLAIEIGSLQARLLR